MCFIKAEMMVKGIVPGGIGMMTDEMIRKGIELSLNLWLQLPYFGTDATYKYIYPELQEIMDAGDIYSTSYAYASTIFNEVVYNNLDFAYDEKAYLEFIYQQRWLDLFRQPNEAWSLARRTKDNKATTPTTIDHQKLVTYRLPYPQSEVTYNYDNYNDQVRKMSHGDTRETKVWWMED